MTFQRSTLVFGLGGGQDRLEVPSQVLEKAGRQTREKPVTAVTLDGQQRKKNGNYYKDISFTTAQHSGLRAGF